MKPGPWQELEAAIAAVVKPLRDQLRPCPGCGGSGERHLLLGDGCGMPVEAVEPCRACNGNGGPWPWLALTGLARGFDWWLDHPVPLMCLAAASVALALLL